ncbi:MAG: hypothetical protein U9N62_06365 [Thermotogota bacterium]|nr:hypothetical protein [Thermotogota bacterium]
MKKIKSLVKSSPIAMAVAGLAVAGVASAALLTLYGSTTGTADAKQSVLFGDGATAHEYDVGNSNPVAGDVFYNLETLVNNSSDKSAKVDLATLYSRPDWTSWYDSEEGITTSYMEWKTPEEILTGVRPSAVYNNTGDKRYEVWYKVNEGDSNIHYAYCHWSGGQWEWYDSPTSGVGDYDCPFVMKENGKYYMVNYGSGSKKEFYIYTSDDGITWASKGKIYSYSGSWNKIDNPKIIKDGDNKYRMYFQMRKESTDGSKYYIFTAKSSASGLKEIADNAANNTESFTIVSGAKTGNSIVEPGVLGEWDSLRVMQPMVSKTGNKGYLMLYTGYAENENSEHAKIGYATSEDGVAWTKVKVSDEGYDKTLGIPALKTSVVKTNDNLVLFYQDNNDINRTWLKDAGSQMTVQPNEIKPFFIENDFAIDLKPMKYEIKTEVKPAI